jgi:hypothetical protein
MNPIINALSLLTPFDIDKPKVRIGPCTDGGYIFVDDFTPEQNIVSYGISTEYRFDKELAVRGHHVFMFDHTIEGIEDPHANMHFFREGVTGQTNQAASMYSIADHLERHDIKGNRLILKMDVEGAEFDALIQTPDAVLARFEQIVLEVHWLNHLPNENYLAAFVTMFRKINRIFTLFHVHANNFDGPDVFHVVGGHPVPCLLELSYVRTSTVERRRSNTLYPTSLDFANTSQRDKLLWMFPFIPATVDKEAFALCADRVDLLEKLRGLS